MPGLGCGLMPSALPSPCPVICARVDWPSFWSVMRDVTLLLAKASTISRIGCVAFVVVTVTR
jgi:hypothetical protein